MNGRPPALPVTAGSQRRAVWRRENASRFVAAANYAHWELPAWVSLIPAESLETMQRQRLHTLVQLVTRTPKSEFSRKFPRQLSDYVGVLPRQAMTILQDQVAAGSGERQVVTAFLMALKRQGQAPRQPGWLWRSILLVMTLKARNTAGDSLCYVTDEAAKWVIKGASIGTR
jgi:hypothetical protein